MSSKQEQLEEIQQLKKELQETKELLKQQEKFAFLGQESAGIIHDIKNKIGLIIMFADLNRIHSQSLQENTLEDSEEKEILLYLKNNSLFLKDEAEQIDKIIKQIDAYFYDPENLKQQEPELVEANINDVVAECLKLGGYYGEMKKLKNGKDKIQLNLETEYDSSISKLLLPVNNLERILLNIIDNSYYAIYEKSQEIGESYSPTIAVKTELVDNSIKIIIEDNGKGIKPKFLKKCINPFFTTKSLKEGTGMGLNIVTRLLEQINGKIQIQSEENEYTKVTLLIPV